MKRLIPIAFFISLLLVFSCGPKPDESPKPPNLIARDTLAMIMYDVHMIDASLTTNVVEPKGVYSRYNLYQSVFTKYNRTEDDFNASMRYYVLNDIMKIHDMYDDVLARLNKEKGELTRELQEDM